VRLDSLFTQTKKCVEPLFIKSGAGYTFRIMRIAERKQRSLVKAITYRFIILLSDGIIIFAITRRYDTTLMVILISNIASTILYFTHERAWNHINWGRDVEGNSRHGRLK